MASVTIQVTAVCAGGDHATVRLTKDGQSRTLPMLVQELRGSITQEDVEAFAKVAFRLLAEGKTAAQFKTAAQAGFTVTI
jgi:hypothetical protein